MRDVFLEVLQSSGNVKRKILEKHIVNIFARWILDKSIFRKEIKYVQTKEINLIILFFIEE